MLNWRRTTTWPIWLFVLAFLASSLRSEARRAQDLICLGEPQDEWTRCSST